MPIVPQEHLDCTRFPQPGLIMRAGQDGQVDGNAFLFQGLSERHILIAKWVRLAGQQMQRPRAHLGDGGCNSVGEGGDAVHSERGLHSTPRAEHVRTVKEHLQADVASKRATVQGCAGGICVDGSLLARPGDDDLRDPPGVSVEGGWGVSCLMNVRGEGAHDGHAPEGTARQLRVQLAEARVGEVLAAGCPDDGGAPQPVVGRAEAVALQPGVSAHALVAGFAETMQQDQQRHSFAFAEMFGGEQGQPAAERPVAFDGDVAHIQVFGRACALGLGLRGQRRGECGAGKGGQEGAPGEVHRR